MTEAGKPATAKELAELRAIEYDLACRIVPDLLDRLGAKKLGESLGRLNGLQDRLRPIERALESRDAERDSTMKELRAAIEARIDTKSRKYPGWPKDPNLHYEDLEWCLAKIDKLSSKPSPALKEKESS